MQIEGGNSREEVNTQQSTEKVTDMNEAIRIASQFLEQTEMDLEIDENEQTWNAATLAMNLVDTLQYIIKNKNQFDLTSFGLVYIKNDKEVIGLSLTAIASSATEKVVHPITQEKLLLRNIQRASVVRAKYRGLGHRSSLIKPFFEQLRNTNIKQYIGRFSDDSIQVFQNYAAKNYIKEFIPIDAHDRYYLVTLN